MGITYDNILLSVAAPCVDAGYSASYLFMFMIQINITLKILASILEPTYSWEGKLYSNINKILTTEQLLSHIFPQLLHCNPTEGYVDRNKRKNMIKGSLWCINHRAITQKQESKTTSLQYARFILKANKPVFDSN